jgi:hypothetical protein
MRGKEGCGEGARKRGEQDLVQYAVFRHQVKVAMMNSAPKLEMLIKQLCCRGYIAA